MTDGCILGWRMLGNAFDLALDFLSDIRYYYWYQVVRDIPSTQWPHRLTVRIPGFHPGDRGSIPREATNFFEKPAQSCYTSFFVDGINR